MINNNKKLLVGLEVGNTKVTVLVGKILPDGIINIIGMGNCPSKGINKGNIHDLKSVIDCIKKSIHEAEIIAECSISSVYLSISDQYINYQNEIGIVPISKNEITKNDVKYAIYTAKAIKLNHSYNILHSIPQEYSIDQDVVGIKNPIGLSGIRMEAKVHLITYHDRLKQNLIKALRKCNLKIKKTIFSGLASSESVLTDEERNAGVCMIDIGGNNIDISIYINGNLQHSTVIPYAGNTVTNDIAYVFNISFQTAEIIKIKYGTTILSPWCASELIEISGIHENNVKKIQKETLIEVIQLRYLELLKMVNKKIIKTQETLYHLQQPYLLGSGIVITGGGSQIISLQYFAEKIFNMQVRIGKPVKITTYNDNIINPSYATVTGLLHCGKIYEKNINKKNFFTKWFKYIKKWLKKY